MKSHQQYVEQIALHTRNFLNTQPRTIHSINIEQYLDLNNNISLLQQYRLLLNLAANGSVLDVGMGVGFSKIINPFIHTTNPPDVGPPGGFLHFQKYINNILDIKSDFINGDCTTHSPWIQTKNQYDFVILHRFLPWVDQTLDRKLFVNIFTDVLRILNESGKVYYTPISTLGLDTNEWKRINTGMNTFEITKQQLYNAIHNTNKVF